MAIDYTDHSKIVELLKEAQEDDSDNRERAREAHHFLDKRDGQWEPSILKNMTGRPRYTFDKCNPVVDDIAGEMDSADFDIRVRPAGGEATKDLAGTFDGIIRNIEAMSNASLVYGGAGREMVASGISGWEVVQDWAQTDSFDQDLFVRPLYNFEDRVWFDAGSELQDRSDSRHCWVLQNLTQDEYKTRFPKGSGRSVGDDRSSEVYTNKPDFVTVGRLLYRDKTKKTLVLMSNGSVYERDEKFKKVEKELKDQGITVDRERKRDSFRVKSRLFDGSGWLTEPEKTVFAWIPIIPTYGNYKIRESKIIYRGAIEKLLDPQRAYNYTRSREVEEVANAPMPKYWLSRKQAQNESDRRKMQTLNTNNDPVQLYTPDPELQGIQYLGGSIINPGLQQASQNALDDIQTSAGRFGVQQGDIDGPLSGVAIQKLQNKGDNGSIKYFKAQEVAICHSARVLVDAIPRVYDSKRQIRVLNEDQSFEMISINDRIFDNETQDLVDLNDLTKGKYDVTCDVGPAFKNRQQETVKALQELSASIPGLAELTADIQMNNIASPGVDLASERVRRKLFEAGNIPDSQMTKEEQAEIQQAQAQAQQQGQQPTPQDKIAEAEAKRVEAETADVISKTQDRSDKNLLKSEELRQSDVSLGIKGKDQEEKSEIAQLTLFLKQQAEQTKQQQAALEASLKGQAQIFETLNTQAQTLKTLREAMGVDTFVGPHITEDFIQQAEMIGDQQDAIQPTPETDKVTNTAREEIEES